MRLFRVKLTDVEYDTYDAAIIACESKQVLEQLIEDGEFNELKPDGLPFHSRRIEYDYKFYIGRYQKVDEIVGVGFTGRTTDKEAVVILASFNAG